SDCSRELNGSTDENYSLSPLSRGEIWAASYSGIPSHCTWLVSVRRRRSGSRRYRHNGAVVGYTGAVARLGFSVPRVRVAGVAVSKNWRWMAGQCQGGGKETQWQDGNPLGHSQLVHHAGNDKHGNQKV